MKGYKSFEKALRDVAPWGFDARMERGKRGLFECYEDLVTAEVNLEWVLGLLGHTCIMQEDDELHGNNYREFYKDFQNFKVGVRMLEQAVDKMSNHLSKFMPAQNAVTLKELKKIEEKLMASAKGSNDLPDLARAAKEAARQEGGTDFKEGRPPEQYVNMSIVALVDHLQRYFPPKRGEISRKAVKCNGILLYAAGLIHSCNPAALRMRYKRLKDKKE